MRKYILIVALVLLAAGCATRADLLQDVANQQEHLLNYAVRRGFPPPKTPDEAENDAEWRAAVTRERGDLAAVPS
jgi:hypothetical protein